MMPSAVVITTAVLTTAPLECSTFKNASPLHLVWIPAIMNIHALMMGILLQQTSHHCAAFLIPSGIFPSTQTTCWEIDSILPLA